MMRNELFFSSVMLLLFLNISSIGLAGGHTVGNGGDAVVCRNELEEIISVELLDYFEGRTLRGKTLDLGGRDVTFEEKLQIVLRRLSLVDQSRSRLYSQWAADFLAETRFVHDASLIDISDYGDLLIDPKCKIEQLAIQRTPDLPDDARYSISAQIWEHMNNDQKAGLVIHEIIYRDAIIRGHTDSRRTRYLNAALSSHNFEDLTISRYQSLMEALQLDIYRWRDDVTGIIWQYIDSPADSADEANAVCDQLLEKYGATFSELGHFRSAFGSISRLRYAPLVEVVGNLLWFNLLDHTGRGTDSDFPSMAPLKITFPSMDAVISTRSRLPFFCEIEGL